MLVCSAAVVTLQTKLCDKLNYQSNNSGFCDYHIIMLL